MRKLISSIILLLLALNVFCDQRNIILNKFMDKSPKDLFKVFHLIFKKEYTLDSDIGSKKFKSFKTNLKKIKEINDQNLSYTHGINQFSDLTEEEFKNQHLIESSVLLKQINEFSRGINSNYEKSSVEIQDRVKIDWSQAFQNPRDQDQCGSCWAFATAGAAEASWWNNNQDQSKIYFSTQQLVDCDTAERRMV